MRKMEIWEVPVVVTTIVVLAVLLLPVLVRSRESCRCHVSCQNNLKQMGLILKMYAIESKGMYPPVSPVPGNWMASMTAVYPEYMTNPDILTCPDSPLKHQGAFTLRGNIEHPGATIGAFHPDCVTALFYLYTGYELMRDEQARALVEARNALPESWFGTADIEVHATRGAGGAIPEMVRKLKDAVLSNLSRVPILWDRIGTAKGDSNHTPAGSNVLYADGHTEFKKCRDHNKPDDFPVTRLVAEVFGNSVPRLSRDCQE